MYHGTIIFFLEELIKAGKLALRWFAYTLTEMDVYKIFNKSSILSTF